MSKRHLILHGSALFAAAMFASSAPSYAWAATQNPTAVTIDKASQSSRHSLLIDCDTDKAAHGARALGYYHGEGGESKQYGTGWSANQKACYDEGYAEGRKAGGHASSEHSRDSDDEYASDNGSDDDNGFWDDNGDDDWSIG